MHVYKGHFKFYKILSNSPLGAFLKKIWKYCVVQIACCNFFNVHQLFACLSTIGKVTCFVKYNGCILVKWDYKKGRGPRYLHIRLMFVEMAKENGTYLKDTKKYWSNRKKFKPYLFNLFYFYKKWPKGLVESQPRL